MIPPHARTVLSDALTPPAGMRFDAGVVTTYSLDPTVLLAMPLHLAWLGLGANQNSLADPILLLEALRRVAGRLTIFSERGRLQAPDRPHPLYGLLEEMIHESVAPHGGAFHAKLWLLRFVAVDGDAAPLLRLLAPSRNLTADRSWDLCPWLEGHPGRAKLDTNKSLSAFCSALPRFAAKSLTRQRADDLGVLSREAWRCQWELPPGFAEVRFHVLGAGRRPSGWLPERSDELGVISPFLGTSALDALRASTAKPVFLLSRSEEMDRLPDSLGGFERLCTLDPQAEISDEEDVRLGQLRGLHAKAYILKRGWNAHLVLGSANATDAALVRGINVEILVELVGRYSKVGRPETWLAGEKGLHEILVGYAPPCCPLEHSGPSADTLCLEKMVVTLARVNLKLHCASDVGGWRLVLHSGQAVALGDIVVDVRPLSVSQERAVAAPDFDPERPLDLGLFATAEVTSLTAFRLRLGEEESCFALDVPLCGGPEDRDAAVLRAMLRNREAFVRYLLLLLADWGRLEPVADSAPAHDAGSGGWRSGGFADVSLFEMLARTWAREPERLDDVAALIERLRSAADDQGAAVIPADFMAVWDVFRAAMDKEASRGL